MNVGVYTFSINFSIRIGWQRKFSDYIFKFTIKNREQFFASTSNKSILYFDSEIDRGNITYFYYITAINEIGVSDPCNETAIYIP